MSKRSELQVGTYPLESSGVPRSTRGFDAAILRACPQLVTGATRSARIPGLDGGVSWPITCPAQRTSASLSQWSR